MTSCQNPDNHFESPCILVNLLRLLSNKLLTLPVDNLAYVVLRIIFFLLLCTLNHFCLRTCPQFWAAYVPCESQHLNAVQLTLEQIDLIKRLIDKYEQHLQFASSAKGNTSVGS